MKKAQYLGLKIGEDFHESIKAAAKKNGVPVSVFVRAALDSYINKSEATAGSGGGVQFNEAELLQKIQNRVRSEIIESEKVLAESFNKQIAQIEAQQLKNLNAQIEGLKTWLMQKFAG